MYWHSVSKTWHVGSIEYLCSGCVHGAPCDPTPQELKPGRWNPNDECEANTMRRYGKTNFARHIVGHPSATEPCHFVGRNVCGPSERGSILGGRVWGHGTLEREIWKTNPKRFFCPPIPAQPSTPWRCPPSAPFAPPSNTTSMPPAFRSHPRHPLHGPILPPDPQTRCT